jgi:PAS domain S-box-containing protein
MNNAKILVVEDERIIAEDIKIRLDQLGYDVISISASGEEAIETAQTKRPDLVVMDIMLGSTMDGIEAAQIIREQFDIPIIFLTAYVDDVLLARAKIAEPFGYILKPFDDRELGSTVEIALYKKKIEAALRTSEVFNKNILNATPNPMVVVDPDTSIRFVNPAFERLTGFSSQEIVGQKIPYPWWSREQPYITNEANSDAFCAEINDSKRQYKNKDGQPLFVLISRKPIFLNDELQYYLVTWIDITEKEKMDEENRNLEDQIVKMQRIEALGTLTGGIAHDFNNVLTIILGNAELALDELPADSPLGEHILEILQSGRRARDMIKRILAFSQSEELQRLPMKVQPIVSEVVQLLRSSLPATIKVCEHIASEGISFVDPTQIHRIVMNLCTNAYHAMRESGGLLEIGIKDVMIDDLHASRYLGVQPGPYVRISVSDNGCGIKKEVMGRIFEPYFTTKEVGVGTGMGLSVVYGIVKGHHGAVTVYSEPGKGSTFHVYLPRTEGTDATAETEEEELLLRGTERILFVDDEKAIVDLGREMLGNLGYTVTTKTDSLEALKLFRSHPDQFDLVITDMTMPNMTGARLSKEIMETCPDMPIILCTGFSELITEGNAKEMGIRGFVMKPFVKSELVQLMRRLLDT